MNIRSAAARAIDVELKKNLIAKYDSLAGKRAAFRQKNHYYYRELLKYFTFIIPEGKKVLEVGCGDGYVLAQLKPSEGVGIDFSTEMIKRAEARNDNARITFFEADAECVTFDETYDFIVLSDLLSDLIDIQTALENVRTACNADTRIIINYHNIVWEPLLKMAEKLGLKLPQNHANWISESDLNNFLSLCDFEKVRFEKRVLFPLRIPLVSGFINKYIAHLPVINRLCFVNFLVVRKKEPRETRGCSVSIVIPCRNEKGNIRPALERISAFGTKQEIIFVDGHSTDGTVEEIQEAINAYPEKDIKLFVQEGTGKGDAVRLAFSKASNDMLMILDADLTVPPEDLIKFYNALAAGKGEFINGCRLVYPMEKQAMRFLNMLGNKFFAYAFSWLLNQNIKDTLCGTKVLLRKDYEKIHEGRDFFGEFDPFGDFDLIFGASKQNLKIIEIPIKYRARAYGETNISRFRHGWLLLRMTFFAFGKLKTI